MTTLTYENGARVEEADGGLTLLRISLKHGLAHLHECGGNARCSTCRVMIREGLENVLPRNPAEQRLADAKGLEPDIRLACQARVRGPVSQGHRGRPPGFGSRLRPGQGRRAKRCRHGRGAQGQARQAPAV